MMDLEMGVGGIFILINKNEKERIRDRERCQLLYSFQVWRLEFRGSLARALFTGDWNQ